MKLVFIHGWGFDARLWDSVSVLLPSYEQQHMNLGFLGPAAMNFDPAMPSILIGHSLGFVLGMAMYDGWRGWIAINSFPRFVQTEMAPGCVSAAALREMRVRLTANPEKTLHDFHKMLGTQIPVGELNAPKLRDGLDALRDIDGGVIPDKLSPGLVIASRNDPLVPIATSEALAEKKEILWSKNGGHVLPLSDPSFCANAIRTFMERHDFSRA